MILTVVFILIFFVLIIGLIIFFQYKRKITERKLLEETWGKKTDRPGNFTMISKYARFDAEPTCYSLTEQTLSDIDIESLFSFVDRTESSIGQQYLFSKLVKPSISIADLQLRKKSADFFVQNDGIRKKAKYILYQFEKKGTSAVVDFLNPGLTVKKNRFDKYIQLLSSIAFLSVLFFFVYKPVALFMIFLFGINLMIHLIFRHNNSDKLKAIRQAYQLICTVDKLVSLQIPVVSEKIPNAYKKLANFKKTYHFLDFGIPLNDISSIIFYILDLVKSYFLVEVHLLNFSFNEIVKNKDALCQLFIYVGQVEMALSTASICSDKTIVSCAPVFKEETELIHGVDLIHPLVGNCIPNSITLDQKHAFITGSNMSGKSTFLRTIVINSILAQVLNLCFAKRFESGILKTFSSIKISDNLQEGTSYYFEEVNIIHEMVLNSRSGKRNLFVIDEIFKGTNTIERIALSKAVLQYLSFPGNIVIASSHDIELIELLGNKFELYHFTESIINEQLHFDHKIKTGPLKTRNAIKILEMEGFPGEIVTEANVLTTGIENVAVLNKLIQ